MRKLPPLNGLKTFECAARHLNLSRAADELSVTPGAVSRAIINLESHLSVALFDRNGKKLLLTEAGKSYLPYVVKALDSLVYGTDELQLHRGQGSVLRVGVLPTLGTRWLIPKLADFKAKFPSIALDIKSVPADFSLGIRPLDLESLDLDLALYFGAANGAGVDQHPICQEKLVPVASESQRVSFKELATLSEGIDGISFLQHTTRPYTWQMWFERYHGVYSEPTWAARFEHYYMLIEAAKSGLGVALVPRLFVENELKQGSLVALEEYSMGMDERYFLIHHKARSEEEKIRLFRDWLSQAMQGVE